MKIYEAVSRAVAREGTELVFGLMGDANQDLICDLGERHGVRIVHGHHEQGVVGMADGYARFSGRTGVATVTQGPGLTNAGTSLVVAERHGSSVLLLAGDSPVGDLHNPQHFDQAPFAHLTAGRGSRLESPRGLDDILTRAFADVRAGRPHVLNLPGDVQAIDIDDEWSYVARYVTSQPTPADPAVIRAAADLLGKASRPAILAGRGAVISGAGDDLTRLGELLGAPLITTLLANGLFARHPLDAGVSGGLGDGRALRVLEACDAVLAVGAQLNQWTTHFGSALAGRRLVQIDSNLTAFGSYHRPDVALHGDAAATVRELTNLLSARLTDRREPPQDITSIVNDHDQLDRSPYLDTNRSSDPRHALAELNRHLPAARTIVIGGGHAAQVACQMLPASSATDWTCTSVDFGAIGQGLSVAIGACFARPGRRVFHVTADGELMMGLAELHTAVRYHLPLTVIVLNDQAFGQERHNLLRKRMPTGYAEHPSPDFAGLARAFDTHGYTIHGPEQLGQLGQALNHDHDDGLVVIDLSITGDYLNPASRDIAEHLG
jgi:acetolactate synthase-1/2/3 large subunit